MKLLQPQPLPFNFREWKQKPFAERLRWLCIAWATQGYGAPVSVYFFYLLKIALYVGVWMFFCSYSTALGSVAEIGNWWFHPEALLKAILWSMLFEGVGLASGSGPLTARYFPPLGGILHFLWPGTIKLPLFPHAPVIGGDKRNWIDILLYLFHIGWLGRLLMASELTPGLLMPTIGVLLVLGLLDRTIFLIARAEHYLIAIFCFLFPEEAISGNQLVWWGIWFWAATSKLNQHFPSVVCVMISNSAVLRFQWLRKRLYKNFPHDLRPGVLAKVMAHMGTSIEYLFPLLLIFGDGGTMSTVGLTMMLLFHLFITGNVPMAVPIEWNVMMVYGGFVLFGQNTTSSIFDISSPILMGALCISLIIVPLVGNFFPRWVSFLLSMRYYAGNWAYSIWLFKKDAEEALDKHIVKSSPTLMRQLALFYTKEVAESLLVRVMSFRAMHLHGRLLQLLVPKAVDNIDDYVWRDGELVAGVVIGWNFGDGHLHSETLLKAIQKRCNYQRGELRCIFVESQPMGQPHLDWRMVDAHDGEILNGRTGIKELMQLQPWPEFQNRKSEFYSD